MRAPNQGTAVIVVGIDPHKQSHTAVAVSGATGELVEEKTVRATDAGHRRLVHRLAALGEDARVALEDVRHVSGRLERALVESGSAVVRVPPRLMGQARRSGRARGKSDPIDAAAVARAALAHPELPAAPLAGAELDLHLLLSHREDLVGERTRTQGRLRRHPHAPRSRVRGARGRARSRALARSDHRAPRMPGGHARPDRRRAGR